MILLSIAVLLGANPIASVAAWGGAKMTPAISAPTVTPASAANIDPTTTQPVGDAAPFDLQVGGQRIPFRVMAAFALPDEEVPFLVSSTDSGYEVVSGTGDVRSDGVNQWLWKAPSDPGVYPVTVAGASGAVTVNVFVLTPYDRLRGGVLEGYRIGEYPVRRAGQSAQYERPRGFIRVSEANEDVLVAPHFRLGQFICKQGEGFPKYVVVQPTLLIKLERLLSIARERGVDASTFQLMSAYRTPVYNRGIGNKTTFTRHQYGDAADIFIDEHPRDGRMDDLDGDGRQTQADARLLGAWSASIDRDPEDGALVGGMSAYAPTASHGPFVHVDTRGYPARW